MTADDDVVFVSSEKSAVIAISDTVSTNANGAAERAMLRCLFVRTPCLKDHIVNPDDPMVHTNTVERKRRPSSVQCTAPVTRYLLITCPSLFGVAVIKKTYSSIL